jgi:hypothetical protein
MSIEHNIVKSLQIVARDGTLKSTVTGAVKLVGGNGFSVKKDTSEPNSFVVSADRSAGSNDPYYQNKYNEMINGSSSVPSPLFNFSGVTNGGYYLSTLNGKAPYQPDGEIAMLGSACGQVGMFPIIDRNSSGVPVAATVEDADLVYPQADSRLSVFDMCTSDVDCEDYYKLFSRMRIINDFLEENKDKNITKDMKLFKQYEACVSEWNYLANMQGIIFKVTAADQYIKVIAGYRMLGCDQPPLYGPLSGVFWNITATLVVGQPSLIIAPRVTGTEYSKLVLRPTITTTTGSNLVATVNDVMYKKDYVVVMMVFAVQHPPSDLSSSSSSGEIPVPIQYNTFQVTGTFYNTHLGVPVTQVKRVQTRYV